MPKTRWILALLCSSVSFLSSSDEIQVHLQSPQYEDGVLTTDKGGVIEGPGIRIQAQNLIFHKRKKGNRVKAWGKLWVSYGDKHFVGDSLEYDFETQKGSIEKGVTQIGNWYLGGQKIRLKKDRSYSLSGMNLSTCSGQKNLWQLHVSDVDIEDHDLIRAKNIQLQILKIPVFWFPYLKARLSSLEALLAQYEFITGGTVGQRLSVRYHAGTYGYLKTYLQGDYWFTRGPSASLQFDYNQLNKTLFKANNFIAFDYQGAHPYGTFRNRFVGELDTTLFDALVVHAEYDKLSDDNVLETYFNRDYFLQIERRTKLSLSLDQPNWKAFMRTEVRINPFDIVSQELPHVQWSYRPFSLFDQPLLMDLSVNMGYYDYVFGNVLRNSPENFRSPRIQLHPKTYLPIKIGPLNITPFAEYIGIGYGQSLIDKAVWNSLGHLSATADVALYKYYPKCKHTFKPYVCYQYYSRPTVSFQNHYLFNMEDSYVKLNQLRWGIKNLFYTQFNNQLYTPLSLDVYTYGFFNNQTIGSFIPKMYLEMSSSWSKVYFQFRGGYNFQHNVIDFGNFKFNYTFSEWLAMSFQYLHRSRYAFTKADFDNFFLDVFRPQAQLLASPLSDQRDVFLTSVYIRPFKRLILEFKSRTGWNRIQEPFYNEVFFTAIVLLPCNWRILFTPRKTVPEGWRWEFGVQLGPGAPSAPESPHVFW